MSLDTAQDTSSESTAKDRLIPPFGALLQEVALTHPQAQADLLFFRQRHPSLTFTAASDDSWRQLVRTAQAVLLGRFLPVDELLDHAPYLRWIHTVGAGVDRILSERLRQSDILLTNSSGVHANNIAEHVLALILGFSRQLPALARAQAQQEWIGPIPGRRASLLTGVFEVRGQTLAIIGLGTIGHALAQKASALGMNVIGVRRQLANQPRPEGVNTVYDTSQLDTVLAQADHVAITLPLTDETHNLFNRSRFNKLRKGAYLYNIGRGPIIDSIALLKALDSGHIAGAGLDVTDPEPLPPESPLWHRPNVVITAHSSGGTPHTAERTRNLFSDNLTRALLGRPLLNLVNKERGY